MLYFYVENYGRMGQVQVVVNLKKRLFQNNGLEAVTESSNLWA